MRMLGEYEQQYAGLINKVLQTGQERRGRNGITRSLFGETIIVDPNYLSLPDDWFPMLRGRQMYYKGVLGELAAFLRGPKHIEDFEKWGCNFWKKWADIDGTIDVDYGNKWIDFNGVNQLKELVDGLKHNPASRRHIVSGWDPSTVKSSSLPCCHMMYQWYVNGDQLEMIWTQRSVDVMIGLPSDVIFAFAWNVIIADMIGLKPGKIKMDFGDTHIYEEHFSNAIKYTANYFGSENHELGSHATYEYEFKPAPLETFEPSQFTVKSEPKMKLKFELKE